MTALRFVSHLSRHHDDAADRIFRLIGEKLGRVVHYEAGLPYRERREMVQRGDADVMWMCGYLSRELDTDVVAAPVFVGEQAPVYRTLILVLAGSSRRTMGDLRDSRLVINERESWSGHHALASHLRPEGRLGQFFESVTESGSHSASLEALRQDRADCAAFDSSIWRVLPDGVTSRFRVAGMTRDWPAPPFSLSRRLDPTLRRQVTEALVALDRPHPAVDDIVGIDGAAYEAMTRSVALNRL
ncbi:MAG TPA: PhnD/SsuA/transferrin family substrate-binding protein [Acidimicrobiia bacterium]|nr:PhnD/SsuA/transferrin family substrate-binding protein [Acidimicrobiia bacterium]